MKSFSIKCYIFYFILVVGTAVPNVEAQETMNKGWRQDVVEYIESISWKQGLVSTKQFLKHFYSESINWSLLVFHDVIKNIFRVQIIEVSGIQSLNQDRILTTLDEEQLHWFWYYAFNGVRNRLKKDPWIKDAVLKWDIYPLRLTLDVEEQQPWIVAEFKNDSFLISDEGVVIESLRSLERNNIIVESSKLPRLNGLDEQEDGNTSLVGSNVRLHHAISLLLRIKSSGGIPFEVDRYSLLSSGGFKITPKDPNLYPELLIAPSEQSEMTSAINRLKRTLSDMELRGETAKQIDLRFANRSVVEYAQTVPESVSQDHK